MEEWRKGWHPEQMNVKGKSENVLVVGSGPAGLEAARALAERGYDVAIAEADTIIGGRVTVERKLPGLSAWGRVVDYREYQISQKPNVETYFDSKLDSDNILEFGFQNVCIATGAIMSGRKLSGKVVIYDDDHYYMGGVLVELLISEGCEVTIITPSAYLSDWTVNTLEQHAIHKKLAEMGAKIVLNRGVTQIALGHVVSNCVYTGMIQNYECDAVVVVASKQENNGVYNKLKARKIEWSDAGIKSVKLIGDANAPGPIAWATYAGHRYARELDGEDIADDLPFRREITQLAVD